MSGLSASTPFQVKATCVPSGENDGATSSPWYDVSDITRAGGSVGDRFDQPIHTARTVINTIADMATAFHHLTTLPDVSRVGAPGPDRRSAIASSMSNSASASDRSRRLGSFSRHR